MIDINTKLQEAGWVKIKNVFSKKEMEEIAGLVKSFADKQILDTEQPALIDQSKKGEFIPRKLAEPFFLAPQFRQLIFSKRIMQLITPIIGSNANLLFDHVFMKPALFGAPKPWHQDGFYFDVTPPEKGISVWIALCDANEKNGCLRYISGSHKLGLLPHKQPDNNPALAQITSDTIDLDQSVFVPAKCGDVILHHFHTVHSSGKNNSMDNRIAYAGHWLGRGCTGTGASWLKSYPLRPEYNQLIKNEGLNN